MHLDRYSPTTDMMYRSEFAQILNGLYSNVEFAQDYEGT